MTVSSIICILCWLNSHLANSADDKLMIFSPFFRENNFYISYILSPMETICMKCQYLFSVKIRKKYFKISSAEMSPQSAKC